MAVIALGGSLSLGTADAVQSAVKVSLQNPVADVSEKPGRQHAVIEAVRRDAVPGSEIGAGPQEIVHLGDDDP